MFVSDKKTNQLRFPGMNRPVGAPKAKSASAKAAAAGSKKTAAAKSQATEQSSDPGGRKVVCKKYTQKVLEDVPVCHMREWLDKMDSIHSNTEVTKKFSKADCLAMLSFSLGFHPRDPPCESGPQA
jgi:hypothetical protein